MLVHVIIAISMLLALLLSAPLLFLAVESLLALLPPRKYASTLGARPRCAILIPAHNEEASIARTVSSILPQLDARDRVVVVADNCSDRTAGIARSLGAVALERHDLQRRGKGYAVDHAIQYLSADPPDVVILVDADCIFNEDFVRLLLNQLVHTNGPVQCRNLVTLPPSPGIRDRLSWFAFVVKNLVRPLGLARLHIPCLTTTGLALPWGAVGAVQCASGNIVEDMQLGLDLAVAGFPATFCPGAEMLSPMPVERSAKITQRTRWEHGHLQTLFQQFPKLLSEARKQRRFDLLGLALELFIPPLALQFLLSAIGIGVLTLLGLLTNNYAPTLLLTSALLLATLTIVASWHRFGRTGLSFATLIAAPLYVLWKLPLYLAFLMRRQTTWIRTARTPPPL